ncbi:MAG: sulfatase [Halanaerobiaceae bacterium]
MKAIMIMFDSLNRRMLPPYGCDWVHAPNFKRLAKKTVTFTNSYVGSMPCMPARRELHTGRYNFLHRSWGPLEPFDDSMPEILKENGIYTHLVSDHMHYWEDGGSTYHTRYNTWEISRGNQGDPWKGEVKDPDIPEHIGDREGGTWRQEWINRKYYNREEDLPQAKTFAKGMEFIKKNKNEDNWFLHIETFDPHEPFYTLDKYKELYPEEDYDGPHFDWPPYRRVNEKENEVEHVLKLYGALISMCDNYLGKVLDIMDEYNLWEDTMLIVNTDHGFLLGEHNWWAKCVQPFYNEVAHTPLFIWDPRFEKRNVKCDSLVQTIDLAPTLLEYFRVDIPEDMEGKPLKNVIASNQSIREAALFGIHGGHINCTDGRYIYMRAPVSEENAPLYNYTLMPTHMRGFFSLNELHSMELSEPFSFTRGCKLMKIKVDDPANYHKFGTMLFDLEKDPGQKNPVENSEIEQIMIDHMINLMKKNDVPEEQYERLGLK